MFFQCFVFIGKTSQNVETEILNVAVGCENGFIRLPLFEASIYFKRY